MTEDRFTIKENRHIVACWAASRAASVIGCRFKVEIGKKILDEVNFIKFPQNGLDALPEPPKFDSFHDYNSSSSKLIPLGKLKRVLLIALLVVFGCEDKPEIIE